MQQHDPDQPTPPSTSAYTPKAILVGCFGAFSVSAGAAYGTMYLHGSFMALGTSMPGAVFLMFVLTLMVNPMLRLLNPRFSLSRRELLLVYIMMVMASPIPTLFAGRLLSTMVYALYYQTPENGWKTLIIPHMPEWMSPANPNAPKWFYEGAGKDQGIPWSYWLPALGAWMPFVWGLFSWMVATMVIFRKQWVQHERLIYPLMQVPLAMAQEPQYGSRLGPLFRNPVMWAGFAIPALWGTLHGLYNYFPAIPLAQTIDPIRFDVSVFNRTVDLYVALRFNILGFFYFLKTDIAFSLWFFNLLSYLARGIFGILGIFSTETAASGHSVQNLILAHQAMGALMVLFLGWLWTARRHLRDVLRKAFIGDDGVDDSEEVLSYRAAVLLLIGSSALIVTWLAMAGMDVWFAIAILFLATVVIVGYSRMVAEGGLSDGSPPVVPAGILVSAVGSSVLGTQGLVILATTWMWTTSRNFVMVSCANALRLGEELGGNRRPLFWLIFLALAIALASGIWMTMKVSHDYGAINLWVWGGANFSYAEHLIRTPAEPHLGFWMNMGIGSVLMLSLMVARLLYVWWPFHPLGYAIGPIWIMDHLWFNMFLSWFIKVMVLKYGGVKLYLKTRPFFIGMILGYFAPGGFFMIIDHFTGMTWNIIFWG